MLRWLTLAATAVMVGVNALANALPINGKTTGQISDGFDILFTPAGYVFSIWGLIYLGLAGFSIVQLRRPEQLAAIRPWYLLNAAANAAWIVAWHHERFGLTLPLMFVILGSLIAITRTTSRLMPADGIDYALVRVPFSLYLAWICIATIANLTVVAWTMGATDALSDPTWTLGIVIGATVLGVVISLRMRDPAIAAVFVWAIVGIARENAGRAPLHLGAWVCVGVVGIAGVVALARLLKPSAREAASDPARGRRSR